MLVAAEIQFQSMLNNYLRTQSFMRLRNRNKQIVLSIPQLTARITLQVKLAVCIRLASIVQQLSPRPGNSKQYNP